MNDIVERLRGLNANHPPFGAAHEAADLIEQQAARIRELEQEVSDQDPHAFPVFTTPPLPQRDGWQPIETAPKDGTYILVSNGRGVWVARFKDVYQSGWKPPCPWQSMMLNHDHIPQNKRKGHPTHWMPLPAAPKPTEDE